MTENMMRLEFPSKPQNVAFARAAVAAFISQLDPTIPELADVSTAVSEAVTNVAVHAYPDDKEGLITITVRLCGCKASIEIVDRGCGISDPQAVRQFGKTTCENERMGIGLSLIDACMDHVELDSAKGRGTRLFMVKSFQQQGGVPNDG